MESEVRPLSKRSVMREFFFLFYTLLHKQIRFNFLFEKKIEKCLDQGLQFKINLDTKHGYFISLIIIYLKKREREKEKILLK